MSDKKLETIRKEILKKVCKAYDMTIGEIDETLFPQSF